MLPTTFPNRFGVRNYGGFRCLILAPLVDLPGENAIVESSGSRQHDSLDREREQASVEDVPQNGASLRGRILAKRNALQARYSCKRRVERPMHDEKTVQDDVLLASSIEAYRFLYRWNSILFARGAYGEICGIVAELRHARRNVNRGEIQAVVTRARSLLPPTVITFPSTMASTMHGTIEVRGFAAPDCELTLEVNGTPVRSDPQVRSWTDGRFLFDSVGLRRGQNRILVQPAGVPPDLWKSSLRAVLEVQRLLLPRGRRDPMTQVALDSVEESEIVRCTACLQYHLREVWGEESHCCLCGCETFESLSEVSFND